MYSEYIIKDKKYDKLLDKITTESKYYWKNLRADVSF